MKKILFTAFSIIILLALFSYRNNNNQAAIISRVFGKTGLKEGDLKYKVNLLGIVPVGDAVLEREKIQEYDRRKVYHLSARAESAKMLSAFFKAKAALDSYVDFEKLQPLLFRQKITIAGRPDIEKETTYDQNAGVMSVAGVRREILPNTQDPLSVLFNLLRLDLGKIREFEFNINTKQKNYILQGTVSLQQVSVNKKIYKTAVIKASIRRRDKNPYHQSRITMVLLREKENTPILIRVFSSGMLITADLIEIK